MLDINPMDIVIHLINIVVLFLILKLLVYKPVKKFMDARTARVQAEMDEAKEAKAKADAQAAEYEARMQKADEEAKARYNEAADKGGQEAARIISEAHSEAAALIEEGKKKAKEEYDSQVAASKDSIVELSVNLAKKVLGREVSQEDNRALIDTYFEEHAQKE